MYINFSGILEETLQSAEQPAECRLEDYERLSEVASKALILMQLTQGNPHILCDRGCRT